MGTDARAYTERDSGFSHDALRDAALDLLGNDVAGVILDAGSGHGTWLKRLLQKYTHIRRAIAVDIYDGGASKLEGAPRYSERLCFNTCEPFTRLAGRVPKSARTSQRFFSDLQGSVCSDSLMCIRTE